MEYERLKDLGSPAYKVEHSRLESVQYVKHISQEVEGNDYGVGTALVRDPYIPARRKNKLLITIARL